MPKELDLNELADQFSEGFSPEQREFLARLLHDHITGLVTTLSMQVEIVSKMVARGMDITDELISLKENVSNAGSHIRGIETTIRPPYEDDQQE